MRNSKFHKYLSSLVLIASLALFVWYLSGHREDFKPLLHINVVYLLLLVLANIGSLFLNGLFMKVILVPFKKTISLGESFYVSLISSVGNYFAPVGAGIGFRAVYLKRKHNLSYGDFMATVAGNYVLVFLVTSLAGLLGLGLLKSHANHSFYVLAVVFAGLFIGDLILISVKVAELLERLLAKLKLGIIVTILAKIIEGWLLIIRDRRLVIRLLWLSAFGFPLLLVTIYLILSSIHLHVAVGGLFLLAALSSLSVFINITPGNIGIKEAVFIFSSQVIGLSTPQILSYALIDRGVLFVVLSVAWVVLHTKRAMPPKELRDIGADVSARELELK